MSINAASNINPCELPIFEMVLTMLLNYVLRTGLSIRRCAGRLGLARIPGIPTAPEWGVSRQSCFRGQSKTGWQLHAYVPMPTHFHLVVKTPQPNLVAGMKWLLGTYTSRFHRRHKLFGHLFSGQNPHLTPTAD
jgi:hypothetical protein